MVPGRISWFFVVPGWFSWFFMIPGWFSMVPGWFFMGFSWYQVGFHGFSWFWLTPRQFFSRNFVTLVADFGPLLKTWSYPIMFYTNNTDLSQVSHLLFMQLFLKHKPTQGCLLHQSLTCFLCYFRWLTKWKEGASIETNSVSHTKMTHRSMLLWWPMSSGHMHHKSSVWLW